MFTYVVRNSNEDPLREIVADELFFASTPLTAIHPDATSYVKKIFTNEHIAPESLAREWRNKELDQTDWIEAIPKHSLYSSIMEYRDELRDWPALDKDGKYANGFPTVLPQAPVGAHR